MQPFSSHTGIVASIDRANIDTDAIIPKQYLKSIQRTGFGPALFNDWRYLEGGGDNPDFELNRPEFKGASILLARHNFGCGSSREHAVWAIHQYGFRVVIAPWSEGAGGRVPAFADIFRSNSIRNGLLCIELEPSEVDKLFAAVAAAPGVRATVDLESQTILLPHDSGSPVKFEIEPAVKNILLRGLDAIAQTLADEEAVAAFEKCHDAQMPRG